jgi:hypothetical protein
VSASRLHREQSAYRVRVVQFGAEEHDEGVKTVRVSRTYATLGQARGQATKAKAEARRAHRDSFTTVTVERATGWETV